MFTSFKRLPNASNVQAERDLIRGRRKNSPSFSPRAAALSGNIRNAVFITIRPRLGAAA
jgi:hypothetical protein